MAEKAALMKVKATLKKRQPKFIRQDAHKHKRVKQVWRAPKGLHSKMKDSRKGYRAKLQGGYQTPKDVRGLDKHGLKPTIVAGVATLAKMDPKVHSIILQGGLGGRKKLAVLEEAAKKKFIVLNAKADAADAIKDRLKKQVADKKAREASKSEKQKSLEQKAKEVQAKKDHEEGKDVATEEEEKKEEEHEKQKILHKKE
jgi:large subunit ribosomal protein L32e